MMRCGYMTISSAEFCFYVLSPDTDERKVEMAKNFNHEKVSHCYPIYYRS